MFGDGFSTPPCKMNPCICGRGCDRVMAEATKHLLIPPHMQIKMAMAITNAIIGHLKEGDFGRYCPGAMALLETQFKGSIGEAARKEIEGFKL